MKAMQIMNKVPAKLRNELQHGAKGLFLLIAILSDAGAPSVNFLNLYSRRNWTRGTQGRVDNLWAWDWKIPWISRGNWEFCVQSQASGLKGLIDMVEVTACGRCQVFSGKGWSYLCRFWAFYVLRLIALVTNTILGNTYFPWAKLAIHVEFMKLELEIDHCQRPCRTERWW